MAAREELIIPVPPCPDFFLFVRSKNKPLFITLITDFLKIFGANHGPWSNEMMYTLASFWLQSLWECQTLCIQHMCERKELMYSWHVNRNLKHVASHCTGCCHTPHLLCSLKFLCACGIKDYLQCRTLVFPVWSFSEKSNDAGEGQKRHTHKNLTLVLNDMGSHRESCSICKSHTSWILREKTILGWFGDFHPLTVTKWKVLKLAPCWCTAFCLVMKPTFEYSLCWLWGCVGRRLSVILKAPLYPKFQIVHRVTFQILVGEGRYFRQLRVWGSFTSRFKNLLWMALTLTCKTNGLSNVVASFNMS